jgi:chromosome segregation ATPase
MCSLIVYAVTARLDETQAELDKAHSDLSEALEEIRHAESAIDEWESRCSELEQQIRQLSSVQHLEHQALTQLREEHDALQVEYKRIERNLQDRENDLKEAHDAIEFQITNSVSDKATALACEALRKHVEELRSTLQITKKDYTDAQEARMAAEEQVEDLRENLAALLGIQNTPENQGEIHRQVIHLNEAFRRKERSELIELKDALLNATERLEEYRTEQMATEERLSKASLQASMYEQELITAKSDLHMLTEKMDEMRQSESSQREALEYRITELETDIQVLHKQNSSMIEQLQSELSQVSMERDGMLKALKESERNKESFFQTKGGRDSSSSESDIQAELTKLRLEKARLLNSVAEEAAKVERRIREARTTANSVAEAEIIVEKELRMSAEKAVAELSAELDSMKNSHDEVDRKSLYGADEENLDELRACINDLEDRNAALSEEITRVSEELQTQEQNARDEKVKLMEELKVAKTRHIQLDRDGRREAEFHSELARLRNRENGGSSRKQQPDNPAAEFDHNEENDDDERQDHKSMDGDDDIGLMYDETKKLKERLTADRTVYQQLVRQHDALLATLTRQTILRRSVQSTLQRIGGDEALEEALQQAREMAESELNVSVDFGMEAKE